MCSLILNVVVSLHWIKKLIIIYIITSHKQESVPISIAKQDVLPVFVKPELRQPIVVEKPGNFPGSDPAIDEDDLKAFHDELDRLINGENANGEFKVLDALINGENPNGEFKSFFRNPSSLTFETVDEEEVEGGGGEAVTVVTLAPKLLPQDLNEREETPAPAQVEKLPTEVGVEQDTEPPGNLSLT